MNHKPLPHAGVPASPASLLNLLDSPARRSPSLRRQSALRRSRPTAFKDAFLGNE